MVASLTLTERKRQRTKTRIVDAAVRLFNARGFEATTADDIAEAAECSRSTLFRYFGTKEDILFGDVLERLEALRATLAALHPCADAWTQATDAGIECLVDYLSGESALPRACITLWFSHPVPRCRYLEIGLQWEMLITEFFATERGTDPESDLHSQILATTLVGAVRAVMRAYARPETDLRATIKQAFAQLERGFGNDLQHYP
jgi:AcrR family transcriptional regulator